MQSDHHVPSEGTAFLFKNIFPFSLSVPSYIYPAGIKENILLLKDMVDEIELVLFESYDASNIPTPSDIREFKDIATDAGIRFNVHLPLDADLAHPEEGPRRHALDTVNEIIHSTWPLDPTTYTLHINKPEKQEHAQWLDTVQESLMHVQCPSRLVSIENLNYDLIEIGPVIESMDFSVCMDIGHLIVDKYDIASFFNHFRDRLTTIHLHGVDENGKDHLPLNVLPEETLFTIGETILEHDFKGTLSIEVFSYDHLMASGGILAWKALKNFTMRPQQGF
ncbi:MAG: hypothetical protein A2268_10225 [Candidatus Raymondbacteria bacterium RifOxyA12_full_50_37]|uniref:Xylose isomerase-like TIM barrel domain-containing protein n=1 Tax=Candidatus Raymondbacteria bacterium RIFOXYD12_FULL_49_13 TaxID=1817890 RepID=A0A1F7FKA9_UNCRA|nr:MAG: hypothetical protein A2268_10225 [Candidatus Raymondbacteria bacterium RifOxyA12_full_50_37]OGJ90141.1 MAG: hypothetical protein A2248_16705 [Candidatus Raymondbacteria bacterium RIFOXYA2_FULL_49_16]OGJ97212.1 MAG: hypothetical protein A2453_01195 [Candidatus Raymondbacteria bacterium RIFOXYC2_FULL_50_21]OGK04707.1 MAG: hypothetical protein A2487_15505 [Candidatus Raymondbacteria bacterium RifOxyC12_full_50_8]OGK07155.1 MAG: hypothetical protein A2519_09400 [Candidatus Raymondbacteria b